MARPRKSRNTRPAARWILWSDGLADLFRLGKLGDWSPPAQARLTGGAHRQTLSARFTAADGAVMTVRLRLVRDCVSGERTIVSEELTFPLMRLGPAGAE
ncbi:hypothetical protein GVN24_24650 [Rhizobium sp. CRIBSB]|nr:hypothetical protein [Rhizobium sp. CRIBSB]